MAKSRSQRELAQTLLTKQRIMRLLEREAGVTAATMSRIEQADEVMRLSRGVWHPPMRAQGRAGDVERRAEEGGVRGFIGKARRHRRISDANVLEIKR